MEIAASIRAEDMNDSFLWVAGRFAQAGKPNRNGHFWELEDLEYGNSSIRHTPLNVLHNYRQPVGSFVESKIVTRENGLPEIQALSVVWAKQFPEVAAAVQASHQNDALWYSMECQGETNECLNCHKTFPWDMPREMACEHLAGSQTAPRRIINPTFMGGALVFPPEKPAWSDANIYDVAEELTVEYAEAKQDIPSIDPDQWEQLMGLVMDTAG
jgi:hypothetical protein